MSSSRPYCRGIIVIIKVVFPHKTQNFNSDIEKIFHSELPGGPYSLNFLQSILNVAIQTGNSNELVE
jgi:hypothetical protein